MKRILSGSLQWRIMLIFIGLTLALTVVLGVIFSSNLYDSVRMSEERELNTLAKETTNKIDRFLFERSADIRVLAASNILVTNQLSRE